MARVTRTKNTDRGAVRTAPAIAAVKMAGHPRALEEIAVAKPAPGGTAALGRVVTVSSARAGMARAAAAAIRAVTVTGVRTVTANSDHGARATAATPRGTGSGVHIEAASSARVVTVSSVRAAMAAARATGRVAASGDRPAMASSARVAREASAPVATVTPGRVVTADPGHTGTAAPGSVATGSARAGIGPGATTSSGCGPATASRRAVTATHRVLSAGILRSDSGPPSCGRCAPGTMTLSCRKR